MGFKMLPIKYLMEFSEEPYRTGELYIFKKEIIAEPFVFKSGHGISFSIQEHYEINGTDALGIMHVIKNTRIVLSFSFRDVDICDKYDLHFLPMFFALANDEVRGRTAEIMLWEIFKHFVILKNEKEMMKHFPIWMNKYKKTNAQRFNCYP